MAHRELQHVLVRMHVDDAFARAVLAAPHNAQLTPELDERDRAHLARLDVRAFLTDPLRRSRLAHAVLLELPVTVATVGMPALFSFFAGGGTHFAAAVRGRGSMALMAAAFFDAAAPGVARIEGAVAHARRRVVTAPLSGQVVRAEGVNTASVTAGALAHYADARGALGADPAARIAAGFRVPVLAAAVPARRGRSAAVPPNEFVLVQGDSVGAAPAGVHALLQFATSPVSRADLERVAVREGAAEDARAVVDDLVADGLLRGEPRVV